MKRRTFAAIAFLLALGWSCHTASAQAPPPLGPPAPKADKNDLPVSVVTNFVKTTVQDAIDSANAQIHQQHPSISLSLTKVTTNVPYRTPTQRPDRPNEWMVDVLMLVDINVSIPATSDRTIQFTLDVNAFCDGWQTGQGTLKLVATQGVPAVEGGNIVEEILQVKDYINRQIESRLPSMSSITANLQTPCVNIGAVVPPDHNVNFSAIDFDPPPAHSVRVNNIGRNAAFQPNLEVTFLRLKRLEARGNGGIIYQPTENIMLSTYTNFDFRQVALTMREGDDVALNLRPVNLKGRLLDSLVVIANIAQQPNFYPEDSSWDASAASANYSPGVHKITVTKQYTIPPGPGHTKPIFQRVPAYELTYNVSYTPPPVTRAATP